MREGLVRKDDGNGGFGEVGLVVWKWVRVWGSECGCGDVCVESCGKVGVGSWVWV